MQRQNLGSIFALPVSLKRTFLLVCDESWDSSLRPAHQWGNHGREGLDPHGAGGAEQVTGVTLRKCMVSQEVSAHSHTQGTSKLSGLHVHMVSLKKERLTLILDVLYISLSAVILLEDASYGKTFFYCIPISFSTSTWEMCKVLPS